VPEICQSENLHQRKSGTVTSNNYKESGVSTIGARSKLINREIASELGQQAKKTNFDSNFEDDVNFISAEIWVNLEKQKISEFGSLAPQNTETANNSLKEIEIL
jgi:hypothetical protein